MKKYGVGDRVYNGELYDFVNTFKEDIPFYDSYCKQADGKILELCCGTGRLTIPLAKHGHKMVGLDFTPSMLNQAKLKSQNENTEVQWVQGDMRHFDLSEKFSLIFIPFNSIQNIYSIEDVEAIFTSVKKHLKPDGVFILDIFNPSLNLMVEREGKESEVTRFTLDDGKEVVITERLKYEASTQINRVEWLHYMDGEVHVEQLDMRCFYPMEMDALLKYNGFDIIEKLGSYEKEVFHSESMKQLFVCKVK